ncbi:MULTISPECIES: hypothetical protein [unclassified Sinorhizobium]|uniref:hypothetical protein n=1 Tax=unclassified Sinorhizobium TaxID=2613772 RepID=UPI003524FFFF
MVFRITPSLGPDVEQQGAPFYWDVNVLSPSGTQLTSYQDGSEVLASDGFHYIKVKSGGANIAAATQVTIDANFVATAGSGGFYTVAAVPANTWFLARKGNTLATG